MPEENLAREVEQELSEVRTSLESLQARLLAGESIDDKELTTIAREVATQIEMVRLQLQEAVEAVAGPISPEKLKEAMKDELTPEEYTDWLAYEEERESLRTQITKEESLRRQLGEGGAKDADGQ